MKNLRKNHHRRTMSGGALPNQGNLACYLRKEGFYIGMMAPIIILFSVLYLYPVAHTVWLSFLEYNLAKPASAVHFVGLDNYRGLFSIEAFRASLGNTLLFVAVTIPIQMLLGIGLALLLNRAFPGKGLMRVILILPIMFAPVIVGYEWRWLFNDTYGLFNFILQRLRLIDRPIAWLSNPRYAMLSIIVSDIWFNTPLVVLIVMGGLQGLAQEPFDSAAVDGANAWQKLRYLTLPLIKPSIRAALMLRIMEGFMVFDLPFILTKGGPGVVTETINLFTYKRAFTQFHLGSGSAASMILLVILLVGSGLINGLLGDQKAKGEA